MIKYNMTGSTLQMCYIYTSTPAQEHLACTTADLRRIWMTRAPI